MVDMSTVNKVIICNPYKKPDAYYRYDGKNYSKTDGRRPASYRVMDKTGKYGKPININAVNYIRDRVDEWRDAGYPGVSKITSELLYHWNNLDEIKLFFCQLEAIETIIYLNEINHDLLKETTGFAFEKNGMFERLCSKMATGTGKTIVMGMLITWQVLNSMYSNGIKNKYTKDVLVITPSLIVLERLQVLKPNNPDNIYNDFNLIPDKYKTLNLKLNLNITNWHKLKPKEKPHKLSKTGTQKAKSLTGRVMGKNIRNNVLVINDEGHHAYRSVNYVQSKGGPVKDDHAGIWMKGLDLINEAVGIKTCYDFSATPFVSVGKSLLDESLFTWIISDFSLEDAVESGLIKTPRSSKSQSTNLEKYERIYTEDDVKEEFKNHKIHKNVEYAYKMIANDWKETYIEWKKAGVPTSPVLITVCNETKHANLIAKEMEINSMQLPEELCHKESMLHIDSSVIKRIEEDKEKGKDKDLRITASTVGRVGMPGEKINNVISVSMLTEGWDAKTVTHIMGLRAFTSQLLCEQVIGRGLRRTSYEQDEDGLFSNEYVTILGVPHGFLPFEDNENNIKKHKPSIEITALDERLDHKIAWPVVDEIEELVNFSWTFAQKPSNYISDDYIPTSIELDKIFTNESFKIPNWKLSLKNIHMQQVEFGILQTMFKAKLGSEWKIRHENLANMSPYKDAVDLLDLISEFLRTGIVSDLKEDNLANSLFFQRKKISNHLLNNLKSDSKQILKPIINKNLGSTGSRKSRFTQSKYIQDSKKTHLDKMTGHNQFELDIGTELDKNKNVLSWIKSDMVGFNLRYQNQDGVSKHYRPDFIIHLKNGIQLILEGKGEERENVKYKKLAVKKWVQAINGDGNYGRWVFSMVYKKDNNNKWKQDLKIILNVDYETTQQCIKCNKKKTDAKNVSNSFKVDNYDGILQYDQVCKDCRLHVQ